VRVLHLIPELSVGGAERVVATLAEALGARGVAVAVAAGRPRRGAEVRVPDYEMAHVARRPRQLLAAVRDARRAVADFRPDVVHAHNPTMAVVAAAARRGRPALVTVHGVGDGDLRRAAVLLRVLRIPVVACGPGVAASLRQHGVRVHDTVVNGVAAAPPAADRDALMRELGLDPRWRLVVCAGRLQPVKNPQMLVRAMAAVPGAALLLVGGGPLHGELQALAARLGVADRVVLCGERADARAVIGAADAVALGSHSEGLPLAALEALSAGRPLVATSVRGIRELVENGRNSLLVAPDDDRAMAAALCRVLSDPALAQRLGAAGAELAARHTVDRMVSDYLRLYAELRRAVPADGAGGAPPPAAAPR